MKLPIAFQFPVKLGSVLYFTWRVMDLASVEADIFSPRVGLCLEVKPSCFLKGQAGALTSDV